MMRVLVKAAGGVDAIFHTAGTTGRAGVSGRLLTELPGELRNIHLLPAATSAAIGLLEGGGEEAERQAPSPTARDQAGE